MTLSPPSDLITTAISSTRCDLSWVNNDNYDFIRVWRKVGAAAWAKNVRLDGNLEHGENTGLAADTAHCYKIFGYLVGDFIEESAFSYGGIILVAEGYTDCVFADKGKQVEADGNPIGLLRAYDNTLRRWFIDTDVIVASGSAMTIPTGTGAGEAEKPTNCATTFALLHAPSDVDALPISDIEIEVTFKDNAQDETHHSIEREISTDPGNWVFVIDLEPNREFFRDGGIFMTAAYTDCVASDIGEMVEADGNPIGLLRAYDNTRRRWLVDTAGATVTDGDAMTIPTGTGVGVADGTTTGLVKDTIYRYQVQSKQNGEESAWIKSVQVVTFDVPTAPVLAAILDADTQDKSIRIRWPGVVEGLWKLATLYHVNDWVINDGVSYICILQHTSDVAKEPGIGINWITNWEAVTGYKIEQDKDAEGYEEVATIGAEMTNFLATGLTPGATYSFKIQVYNAAGDSGYSNIVSKDALSAYVPTEFEKWIRDPNTELIYLAEIYTKMDLTDFVIHGAGPAWKKTIGADDRGIDILEVFEDGTAYTAVANVAAVEALASSFWFDYANRILYVRSSAGDGDPAAFLIEGAFWLYFSTHKDIEFTVASGRLTHYLPLLAKEDIPDITQEIKPYYEGSFLISSASIAFINGKIGGNYFFDIKYKTYTWENSKVILKSGKGGTYANFETILTSLIDKKNCNDSKITFTLRDIRQEMERDLILTKFNVDEEGSPGYYPDIEEDFIGEPIPLCFGTKYRVVPIPINVARRKYKFHDGRSKSVEAVYKNPTGVGDTALTEDADYFVDLQHSIITFKRDEFELGPEDIIEITFIGTVNSADEPIAIGAEIFKYFMNIHYGLLNSELNLDSIYKTKYAKTNPLSVFLYKDQPYREIVRTIEHSSEAYTFQDTEGRLGLKVQLAVAESKAKYIRNYNIFNHQQSKARKLLFWKVNVFYNELPQSQEWEVKSAQDDNILYRYKNRNELNIYSYFSAPSPAQDLATSILALLNKETIEDAVSMLLFDVSAGDIVKFSRDRFYSAAVPPASEIDLRIIRISKSPASGQTSITAELV